MRKALWLPVLVAACATAQSESDKYLPAYQGKPVDNLFARWSAPTRSIKADGGTVYVWENTAPDRDCKIEAHVSDFGNVMGWRFVGTEPACQNWMRLLR